MIDDEVVIVYFEVFFRSSFFGYWRNPRIFQSW